MTAVGGSTGAAVTPGGLMLSGTPAMAGRAEVEGEVGKVEGRGGGIAAEELIPGGGT